MPVAGGILDQPMWFTMKAKAFINGENFKETDEKEKRNSGRMARLNAKKAEMIAKARRK